MPKTEVILVQNIVGLGAESDQVKVAAGYARNYLLPQRLAIPLNAANKKQLESLRKRRAEREAADLNTMTELAASLGKLLLKMSVKTGDDGKMFGAITSGSIADELKNQFAIALDKKKIHLEHPIRTLGEHEIEMRLHPDVNAKLRLVVESSTPPAPPSEETPAPATAEPRGRRGDRYFGRAAQARAAAEKAPATASKPSQAASAPAKATADRHGKPTADKKEKAKQR
jgi:large subunit ribosomal protein L9